MWELDKNEIEGWWQFQFQFQIIIKTYIKLTFFLKLALKQILISYINYIKHTDILNMSYSSDQTSSYVASGAAKFNLQWGCNHINASA